MKKYFKNLILTSMPLSVLSIALTAVSCSTEHPKKPKELIAKVNFKNNLDLTEQEALNAPKIALIPDGNLYDNSFHQSGWEGIIQLAEHNNISLEKYDAFELDASKNFKNIYDTAMLQGSTIWVLVGFDNKTPFEEYYQSNKQKFIDNKIIVVTVDFETDPSITNGNVISLLYNSKEGGFIAGYAAGEYLSTLPEEKRTFNTFGGQLFDGVTDYMEGFLKGILYWNTKNPTKKLHSLTRNDQVYVNALFDITAQNKQSEVENNSVSLNPTITLPVGGLWTQFISAKPSTKYVVGVDTDQSLADSAHSSKYFTSVLKNIAQSVYESVSYIIKKDFSKLNGFKLLENNAVIKRGVSEDWVNVSSTHVVDDAPRAERALDDSKEIFKNLNSQEREWINSSKATMEGNAFTNIQERLNELAKATK
ncbi:BMP family ABC transporter substrate-binding protein [Mycoplasmopsis meleagridis]|uniref:BMP family ABC transporter substrate-binding protein n=1 Tax=Mycoplasmopsis meleagridis TaxID=29561 RepID=UPI00073D69D6|nr:BMP family ABC transporter substrate-binding protein [Mycoplasmopsis meleagridis]KUH47250.1 hypothetical protein ASB56_02410 [Mycoplasmopsis meleagridis]